MPAAAKAVSAILLVAVVALAASPQASANYPIGESGAGCNRNVDEENGTTTGANCHGHVNGELIALVDIDIVDPLPCRPGDEIGVHCFG